MATAIRLSRHGAKKRPYYRIIVTDSRAPRDGRRLDQIGTYDPSQNPARVTIQEEKLTHWLRQGALPSLTVRQLLQRSGMPALPPSPAEATAAPAPDPGDTQT